MPMHPRSVTSTDDGTVFAMAHPQGDHDKSLIYEIGKTGGKAGAKKIHELSGVESVVAHKKALYAIGGSFEDGPQVHVFDGKKWKTHATGDASIHSGVVVDGKLIGVGRDGYVGTWDKTKWKLATKEQGNLHLSGATYDFDGELVVVGTKAGKGVFGSVSASKVKPSKVPSTAELLGITRLSNNDLLATGREATVLIGRLGAMLLVPPGKKMKADYSNPIEWEGRALIAGRADGVIEYDPATGELTVFPKDPAQRLAVTGTTLWKLDLKTGLGKWTGKAWAKVDLPA